MAESVPESETGYEKLTRRNRTNIDTSATDYETTPLQHAFIRTLLLSQRPEGYCSMCKALGDASPPDYAASARCRH